MSDGRREPAEQQRVKCFHQLLQPVRVVAPISAWASRGHAIVGELVRRHLATGASLRELVEADARLGPDAAELVAPGVGVQQGSSPGGAGPAAFDAQLTAYRQLLADERRRLDDR